MSAQALQNYLSSLDMSVDNMDNSSSGNNNLVLDDQENLLPVSPAFTTYLAHSAKKASGAGKNARVSLNVSDENGDASKSSSASLERRASLSTSPLMPISNMQENNNDDDNMETSATKKTPNNNNNNNNASSAAKSERVDALAVLETPSETAHDHDANTPGTALTTTPQPAVTPAPMALPTPPQLQQPKSALKPPSVFPTPEQMETRRISMRSEQGGEQQEAAAAFTPLPVRYFVQRVESLLKNVRSSTAELDETQTGVTTQMTTSDIVQSELNASVEWCRSRATPRNAVHAVFLLVALYSCFHVDVGGASRVPRVSRACTSTTSWGAWAGASQQCTKPVLLGWMPVGKAAPAGMLRGIVGFFMHQLGFDGVVLLLATMAFWLYMAVQASFKSAKPVSSSSAVTVEEATEVPAAATEEEAVQLDAHDLNGDGRVTRSEEAAAIAAEAKAAVAAAEAAAEEAAAQLDPHDLNGDGRVTRSEEAAAVAAAAEASAAEAAAQLDPHDLNGDGRVTRSEEAAAIAAETEAKDEEALPPPPPPPPPTVAAAAARRGQKNKKKAAKQEAAKAAASVVTFSDVQQPEEDTASAPRRSRRTTRSSAGA
ncbi:EF-hand domain-containing protein [Pseudoscourfieldia marina]